MKLIDLAGQGFGYLKVLEKAATRNGQPYWSCECVCGMVVDIAGVHLRSGESKSCGCQTVNIQKETMAEKFRELPSKVRREYAPALSPCMRDTEICYHGRQCLSGTICKAAQKAAQL